MATKVTVMTVVVKGSVDLGLADDLRESDSAMQCVPDGGRCERFTRRKRPLACVVSFANRSTTSSSCPIEQVDTIKKLFKAEREVPAKIAKIFCVGGVIQRNGEAHEDRVGRHTS